MSIRILLGENPYQRNFETIISLEQKSVTIYNIFEGRSGIINLNLDIHDSCRFLPQWFMIFFPIHDSRRLLIAYLFNDVFIGYLAHSKTGNKKQNELNSDVARFTTHENLAIVFLARQGRTWVVKRATSLFNLVCSNFAKQVARFLLPVLLQL